MIVPAGSSTAGTTGDNNNVSWIIVDREMEVVVPVHNPITRRLSLNMEALGAPHGYFYLKSDGKGGDRKPLAVRGTGSLGKGEKDLITDAILVWMTKHRAPLDLLQTYLNSQYADAMGGVIWWRKAPEPFYPLRVVVLKPEQVYERRIVQDALIVDSGYAAYKDDTTESIYTLDVKQHDRVHIERLV